MARMLRSFFPAALGLAANFASLTAAPAQQPSSAAADRLIRIWGNDAMGDALAAWEVGFQKKNPDVRFENNLYGTDTGIAGLYTGVADIALMGRDIYGVESMAFAWVQKYRPTGYQVGTGGLDAPRKSSALVVLVNKDNPLTQLTLAQLDAIFGYERRAGAPRQAKTWGDLGLSGEWANKPIHAYARRVDNGTAVFFRQQVMRNSNKWNWEVLTEFVDKPQADADAQINGAVADDPDGLGVATAGYSSAKVKPIAVAETADQPAISPTTESVGARVYPLARPVFAYVDRKDAKSLSPHVIAFLQYVLSAEGQEDLKKSGSFLPLSDRIMKSEIERLSISQVK